MPGKKNDRKKNNAMGKSTRDKLKEEVASELGLKDDIRQRGWANLTSRETGKIGGYIAKRLRKKQSNKYKNIYGKKKKDPLQ